MRPLIKTVYTKGSTLTVPPSYDGFMLFKIELLCVWYGLSDEGAVEVVNERISFSRFVGSKPARLTKCPTRSTGSWRPKDSCEAREHH